MDLALRTPALIISNEEMKDIMKIIKSLEESVLLIKGINETIKNEAKEKKNRISLNVISNISCQYVCACVSLFVCVCLRPSTVKVSSVSGWNSRGQINDVVLQT